MTDHITPTITLTEAVCPHCEKPGLVALSPLTPC